MTQAQLTSFDYLSISGLTGRAFNSSMVRLDNERILYVLRYVGLFSAPDDKIIPGNSSECQNAVGAIGHNFPWNDWGNSIILRKGFDMYFFIMQDGSDFTSIPVIHDGRESTYFLVTNGGDFRLSELNDQIVLYESSLRSMFHVRVIDQKVILNKFLSVSQTFGKNLVPIELNNSSISFLEWFYTQGVKVNVSKIDANQIAQAYTWYLIPADPHIGRAFSGAGSYDSGLVADRTIFGTNYGISPAMSFSTPTVEIYHHKYGRIQLGVGHSKIHSDYNQYPYLEGSPIDLARRSIDTFLIDNYGSRYIKHFGSTYPPNCQGYLYLLFFYILIADDYIQVNDQPRIYHHKITSMLISDSYLPVYMGDKNVDGPNDQDYKFSLVFPMGLIVDQDKLSVSAGYGDFYSIILTYDLNSVVDSCRHDSKNLDFRDYNYFIQTIEYE